MIRKKKSLGQHFLHDQNVLDRIVESVDPKLSDNLIEIGPGVGALTCKLLPLVDSLDVVEIDKDVIPELKKNCDYSSKLHVHLCDVLKFDFTQFESPIRLVGNLPYNISTPLLFYLISMGVRPEKRGQTPVNPAFVVASRRRSNLQENNGVSESGSLHVDEIAASFCSSQRRDDLIQDMHFMLQKEVAERITAKPGTKAYGRLSIMLQYHCETKLLLYISSRSFSPPPKVDSAFIRLIPRKQYKIKVTDENRFTDVVRDAFNHRRKTIANGVKKHITSSRLEQIGIDPGTRPEQLSVEDFVKIADASVNKL